MDATSRIIAAIVGLIRDAERERDQHRVAGHKIDAAASAVRLKALWDAIAEIQKATRQSRQ